MVKVNRWAAKSLEAGGRTLRPQSPPACRRRSSADAALATALLLVTREWRNEVPYIPLYMPFKELHRVPHSFVSY